MPVSPALLDKFRGVLVRQAGGYLRNPVRLRGETCDICTTPTHGAVRCGACARHAREAAVLADAVAPLTYAIAQRQSGYVMRGYKGVPRPVEEHRGVVAMLALLGLQLHGDACPAAAADAPVTHWAIVPSLPAKDGPHPLRQLVYSAAPGQEITLRAAAETAYARGLDVAHYTAPALPESAHVLLLEDTWVGGGHAQSAALALRHAGAAHVSIMVVARWVRLDWEGNEAWMRKTLTSDYDPLVCPWTGGTCP